MVRLIVASLIGYTVFAGSAVLLFQLSGVDPHGPSDWWFRLAAIAYGATFALIVGYLAAAIAHRHPQQAVGLVASFVAIAGAVSLVARPGEGAVWTQVASIILFAPLVIVGARLKRSTHLGSE